MYSHTVKVKISDLLTSDDLHICLTANKVTSRDRTFLYEHFTVVHGCRSQKMKIIWAILFSYLRKSGENGVATVVKTLLIHTLGTSLLRINMLFP